MPIQLRFPLKGPVPETPHEHAAGLYRLVLDLLDAGQPGISKPLHDKNEKKPLAISPIWTGDQDSYFDVSLLDDRLLKPLVEGAARVETIRLGGQRFLLPPAILVADSTWAMLRDSSAANAWGFRLMSPTAHKPAGATDRRIVLPSPELYFGSWLSQWNRWSDIPIDSAVLDFARSALEVTNCAGATETIRLPRGSGTASAARAPIFTGFVGKVRFRAILAAGIPSDRLQELSALAAFSRYCGTGLEVMRGMGQTSII